MDITETTAPRSDQINYDDVAHRSITVTVSEVKKGSAEQPVEVHLNEYPGRPYKPGRSMRRVLVAAWGPEASAYVGRQLTLYGDPEVKFGGQKVGGIRISHLSHIDAPVEVPLTVTRGQRKPFTVQPLFQAPPKNWLDRVSKVSTLDGLQKLYDEEAHLWFTDQVRAAFTARKTQLQEAQA